MSRVRTYGGLLKRNTGAFLFGVQVLRDLTGDFQMRSADEGSTILYTVRVFAPPHTNPVPQLTGRPQCVACKHGWRVNN